MLSPTLWLRRLCLRRQLRKHQNRYYDAAEVDPGDITGYLDTLAQLRSISPPPSGGGRFLHVGSGGHRLSGWINADVFLDDSVDVRFDATTGFPFADRSFELIHCEDFIEHITRQEAASFARECTRILVPDGVLRVLTPDLRAIIDRVYVGREKRHLDWAKRELDANSPCQAFNAFTRMDGDHKYIYDHDDLRALLRDAGFTPRRAAYNRSKHPRLRDLDLRDFGLSIYMEGVKRV